VWGGGFGLVFFFFCVWLFSFFFVSFFGGVFFFWGFLGGVFGFGGGVVWGGGVLFFFVFLFLVGGFFFFFVFGFLWGCLFCLWGGVFGVFFGGLVGVGGGVLFGVLFFFGVVWGLVGFVGVFLFLWGGGLRTVPIPCSFFPLSPLLSMAYGFMSPRGVILAPLNGRLFPPPHYAMAFFLSSERLRPHRFSK